MAHRAFKAVPLKLVVNRPPRRPRRPWWRRVPPIMIALPLAAFTGVFLWDGPPKSFAFPWSAPLPTARDREAAHFGMCSGPVRIDCVVDGDTFWYRGEKIRIADINTPETHDARCAYELELGNKATARLQALLNAGPFTLQTVDRDRDVYGRLLRTVTREGASVGHMLVDEGLAEEWRGYRRNWC